MGLKMRMDQGLRATGEAVHSPTIRQEAFGEGPAKAAR